MNLSNLVRAAIFSAVAIGLGFMFILVPNVEFISSHLVSSESLDDKQTFKDTFELSPGEKILAIGFLNDYWESDEDDRD